MPEWWRRSDAKDVTPLPWLSPRAIEKLESILQENFRVFEHGSGGSTLWFAERVRQVVACENNSKWLRVVQGKVSDNVTISPDKPTGKCDLLLIDGEPIQDRAEWIYGSLQMVKPGGWIVLDNANRKEYADARAWLQGEAESCETIDANEQGTLFLVTDFYKLKGRKNASRSQPE